MTPAVSVPAAAGLPAACRALYPHLPPADRQSRAGRALALFSAGELDPAGLLVATDPARPGELLGAMLTQPTAGGAAVAWPPRAEPGPGHDRTLAALAAAAVAGFRAAGVKVAQAFHPPADRPAAAPLERAGFRRVTTVEFLCRPLAGWVSESLTPPPLHFRPADDRLPDLLSATYDGTLDCPELNGTRTPAEVVSGYRGGAADPPDWWLALDGADPAGVVLFAAGAPAGVADLSYLGLIPAARGKGLGRVLVDFALDHLSRLGAEWVNLCVDVRNLPARKLYAARRFRRYDEQDVFLWTPGGGPGCS